MNHPLRNRLPFAAAVLGMWFASSASVPVAFPSEPARTADHDYDAPVPGSYRLPVIKAAADGEVLGSDGRVLRLGQLMRGRITVLSFIYTRCAAAKACPYATGVLDRLHRESEADPALAANLRLISMSFDPANDTPERMAAYGDAVRERHSAAEWRFVTTRSAPVLQPILDAYGQAVDRKQNPADPAGPLNHTLRVFLIDGGGRIRNVYSSGTLDPRLVLADIRTLLMEQPHGTSSLTPEQAARHAGEVRTVGFRVETAAQVTDITDRDAPRPLAVQLMDARNDGGPVSPAERAGVVVQIPASALAEFRAASLEELAGRFQGRQIAVTGRIELEPHPVRHDSQGNPRLRPVLTVLKPDRIRVAEAGKQADLEWKASDERELTAPRP